METLVLKAKAIIPRFGQSFLVFVVFKPILKSLPLNLSR